MARRQGGTLSGFTPLSTPNAPTDLSVSAGIGSATVSFTAPTDTGDGAITSYIVTAVNESTGASTGATGTESPINISPGGGTFKIRMQAVNGFGPGRLTEYDTGNVIYSGQELYAWGAGGSGRLGDGTTVNKSSPVQIGALTDWSQVSAAKDSTSAAVKTDGTLWTWGSGSFGALGDGTTVNKSSPVQIGALTDWSQVSTGASFAAAVKTNGALYAWGNGANGRLGVNNTTSYSSPVQVGALTTWAFVSLGTDFTVAVKTDGTLWAWGNGAFGRLGTNDTISRSSPVQVGALTTWYKIDVGTAAARAIKTDGSLWGWGLGLVGDNTNINRSSPVQIGALTNWSQVAAGPNHTISTRTDGTLWAWGSNLFGQIGNNTAGTYLSSPVQIGALTDWSLVSAGVTISAAVKTDGTLWAWGRNNSGQLGDGTIIHRSSPVQIGVRTDWSAVSSGSSLTMGTILAP